MSDRDDFFDDLLGGTQPGVEGVLRDLRRLADQPAPRPGTALAAFLAAPPAGVPTGRLTPLRLRITRLAARTASMGAVGAIVLGGGAVAMACVGAVTVAHVTSPDPKPPASVSTLVPGQAEASESPEAPEAGATQSADGSAAAAGTARTGPTESTQSLRPSEPADPAASTANHTDGQGQDDQRADVHSGGPVDHQGDQWRQGFGQGFGGPKTAGGPSGTGGTGGSGGSGHSGGGQQGGGH